MEDISEEQQAAMALKLMDNVKQMIVETVVEDLRARDSLWFAIEDIVRHIVMDTRADSSMSASVKAIAEHQILTDTSSYSPLHTAVRQIVSSQMAKY